MMLRVRKALRSRPLLRWAVVTYRNRGIRECDVVLDSYMRSGSTWTTFLLAHLVTGRELPWETIPTVIPWVETTVPWVGRNRSAPAMLPSDGRIVRSHEPYRPWHFRTCRKAIYVARDGRDVAVSFYHYRLGRGDFEGSFSDFLKLFLDGRLNGYGAWHRHVESWLSSPLNTPETMLIIRYEDLLRDTHACLSSIAGFCGLTIDEEMLRAAIESNTAERMRDKEKESKYVAELLPRKDMPFVRSATSGDWQQFFRDEDLDAFMAVARPAMERLGYLSGSEWERPIQPQTIPAR